ncbi:uncharacterized protein VTP21DRAFT_4384 [Calcarisporiella thermophila]|uniref:uncharacterized protein n=1 Tax=Calcarisporiella thermophila TaxID=911321 RepID=UPI0037427E4C
MFAATGLFKGLPCPYGKDRCGRDQWCLFSHELPTLVTRKKALAPETHERQTIQQHAAKRQRTQAAEKQAENAKPAQPALPKRAVDAPMSKKPKESSDPSAPTPRPQSSQPPPNSIPIAAPRVSPKIQDILPPAQKRVAYHQEEPEFVPQKKDTPLPKPDLLPPTHRRVAHTPAAPAPSEPPLVPPDINAHTARTIRQNILNLLFKEFNRIYAPLLEQDAGLAAKDALRQEKSILEKSNKGTYKNVAAQVLARLKRRPLSTGPKDAGIEGEWRPPASTH